MAPEVVRERYTLSADLWSVGVMAYLLLTGRLPFPFWDTMYIKRQVCASWQTNWHHAAVHAAGGQLATEELLANLC